MTSQEFVDWVRGYLDGINAIHPLSDSPSCGYGRDVVDRIREKVDEVAPQIAAPPPCTWDRTIAPGLALSRDCNCPNGTVCMNIACPRALKVT